jgi:hypothetical protein
MLFGDIDFALRDVTVPIESILQELKLYPKSTILPANGANKGFAFYSFAVVAKNSDFGRRVVLDI